MKMAWMSWCFYDITASSDQRNIMLDVVQKVAQEIFIPFSVGGGIRTREDAAGLLMAGAEKISLNSAAVLRPGLIKECAQAIGTQNTVLSMDVRRVAPNTACPSGYEVVINGGRKAMGMDAIAWARQGCELGAGEIVVNSIDADGMKQGYEIQVNANRRRGGAGASCGLWWCWHARAFAPSVNRRQGGCGLGCVDGALR